MSSVYSKDEDFGLRVRTHLISKGVETPFTPREFNLEKNEGTFATLLEDFGLDLSDDSLSETPRRLAKMYSPLELFAGLDYKNFPKATVVENKMSYDEMLIERNIQVYSMCGGNYTVH